MNEGWSVEAKCPHGKMIRIPLAILQSYGQLSDPCLEAQLERARSSGKPLSRKEKRKWGRLQKGFDLIAQNAEPPPSSETKEPP